MLIKPRILVTLVLLCQGLCGAQQPLPEAAEPGSVEEIAHATTEPRFLSPWVAYLPASAGVVSPRAFLHRIPGAPGELVNSATAYAYCARSRPLRRASRLFTIGRSEEGPRHRAAGHR